MQYSVHLNSVSQRFEPIFYHLSGFSKLVRFVELVPKSVELGLSNLFNNFIELFPLTLFLFSAIAYNFSRISTSGRSPIAFSFVAVREKCRLHVERAFNDEFKTLYLENLLIIMFFHDVTVF